MTDDSRSPEEQLKNMQEELERLTRLVYYDELTGVLNRRGFLKEAGHAFYTLSEHKSYAKRRVGSFIPFSIVFLDIDNFKMINDAHGHAAGDEVLRCMGETLQKNLRVADIVGRFGGEEFIAALVGTPLDLAMLAAEKLRHAVESIALVWKKKRIPLAASFGVAEYSREKTLNEVIAKADRAMYRAKRRGKNRVVAAA